MQVTLSPEHLAKIGVGSSSSYGLADASLGSFLKKDVGKVWQKGEEIFRDIFPSQKPFESYGWVGSSLWRDFIRKDLDIALQEKYTVPVYSLIRAAAMIQTWLAAGNFGDIGGPSVQIAMILGIPPLLAGLAPWGIRRFYPEIDKLAQRGIEIKGKSPTIKEKALELLFSYIRNPSKWQGKMCLPIAPAIMIGAPVTGTMLFAGYTSLAISEYTPSDIELEKIKKELSLKKDLPEILPSSKNASLIRKKYEELKEKGIENSGTILAVGDGSYLLIAFNAGRILKALYEGNFTEAENAIKDVKRAVVGISATHLAADGVLRVTKKNAVPEKTDSFPSPTPQPSPEKTPPSNHRETSNLTFCEA